MWRIFWGFCRNWFLIDPLHYLLSHSDFGFKFEEILNWKTTPRLGESGSRWLSNSPSRRVVESSLYRSSKGSSSNTFKCGPVIAKRSEVKWSESFDNDFFQYRSEANMFILRIEISPALLAPPCQYEAIRVKIRVKNTGVKKAILSLLYVNIMNKSASESLDWHPYKTNG